MRNLNFQTCVHENKDRKKYHGYFVILIHFLVLKEFVINLFFLQEPFSDEMHNTLFTCSICMWT